MVNIKRASFGAIVIGVLLMLAAAGLQATSTAQAAVLTWKANLTGAQENPPVPAGFGAATAEFYFDDAPSERTLTYFVTVTGIDAEKVTAAHIHRGAVGVNGPVIYPISAPGGATSGVTYFAGTVKLTEADVTDLRAGNLYVNVHSQQYPGGFARAQPILPGPEGITAAARAAVAAWNDEDVDRFLSVFTDAGLETMFGFESREQAEEELPEFIGSDPVALHSLTNIRISGNTATGDLVLQVGTALEAYDQSFVLVDGAWKLDVSEMVDPPVPAGFATVQMDLQEFAFVYNKSQMASGRVAIHWDNIGEQPHEIVLFKFDSDEPLLTFLQNADLSEEAPPPPELEFIAARAPIFPEEEGTLVFAEALDPGRYALLCFFPDTDDPEETPHALKGMLSDFVVTGGATVTPPSTGDAGLLGESTRGVSFGVLAIGLVAIFAGYGGVMLAVRRAR